MAQLFTVDEANEFLPQIESLFREVHAIRDLLHTAQDELGRFEVKARSNGHDHAEEVKEIRDQISTLAAEQNAKIQEILSTGCEIKDVDSGLIDFQSNRDGRVVYLCWKLGEDRIRFWHELADGFAGRQPL